VKATEVTAGLAESNGSLLPGLRRDSLHVTCGLTAYRPGSAPGPTLGNEYGKTLPFWGDCKFFLRGGNSPSPKKMSGINIEYMPCRGLTQSRPSVLYHEHRQHTQTHREGSTVSLADSRQPPSTAADSRLLRSPVIVSHTVRYF